MNQIKLTSLTLRRSFAKKWGKGVFTVASFLWLLATLCYVVAATNVYGVSPDSSEATPGEIFGWWKFDATSGTTAADSGSGGNPGTLQSGATWVAGAISNAVHLDGTANGYASLPSGLVSALNDFTISTWVKVDANATWARVFDFGSGTGNYMFLSPASGGASVRYAITTGSGEQQLNRAGNLSTGVWHHLAVTLSGSTGVLYVDGVPADTNLSMTLKPSSLGSTTQNYIGKSQWSDPNLTGSVDDFRIYSRALSATEVAALVNPVPAAPAAPAGLAAVAGNAQVVLNWNDASGATGYNVKRATVSGGSYTTIVVGIPSTSYTDTGLTNGSAYYYVVSAMNSGGESASSSEVSATPLSAYQEWKLSNGLSLSLPDTATPDNDGVPILLKYATGLTPGTPSTNSLCMLSSDNNTLGLQFTRLSPAPVTYTVESSTDLLSTWMTIATLPMATDTWTGPAAVAETGTGATRATTVIDTQAMASGPHRFLRLSVDINEQTADPGNEAPVFPNPGINLGNTLEAFWQGAAAPTKALIDGIANAGFKTLRVPCSWDYNSTNGTIDAAYMAQVKQVVDWALADGLYVIINDHYDLGWFERNGFDSYDPAINSRLINLWTQVANTFKWYDSDRLAFACANEPDTPSQAKTDVLYQYQQNWVTAMRANGGGNAVRWLIVQGPNTNIDETINWGKNLPSDPANKRMVEVHFYSPFDFCLMETDESWGTWSAFWGNYKVSNQFTNRNVKSGYDESAIDIQLAKMKYFTDRGIPVLIGEYRAGVKPDSLGLTGLYKEQNYRATTHWNKYVQNKIASLGFIGTGWVIQHDLFHETTGEVLDWNQLGSMLGTSEIGPISGL